MSGRSRGWCLTLNNYEERDIEFIGEICRDHCRYGILGRERGEAGTPHIQGYLYFDHAKSFQSVVKLLNNNRIHLEAAKGSPQQNRTYCSKDGEFTEYGSIPVQGRRTDLTEIQGLLDSGVSEVRLAQEYFSRWCQYRRSFTAYRELRQRVERHWKTNVVWIYGPTGTGKTFRAVRESRELSQAEPWIAFDNSGTWFDGYSGQKCVIFDDFRGECPLAFLLRLLDRYPMQVPIKGGSVNWQPRIVFITSNVSPRDAYSNGGVELLLPLYRRIETLEYQYERDRVDDHTENIKILL